MTELDASPADVPALLERIARLERTNAALMRRVEADVDRGIGTFALFETARTLEAKVHERTHKLEELQRALLQTNQDLIRALAEGEQSSRAKADFLANVSHEIRTPMNGVLGILELVLGRPEAEPLRSDLLIVQNSTKALLALLDDLLEFSKAEAGALELESVPFDVATLLEDVVDLFADGAARKGIALSTRFDSLPERPVIGDPGRLRQVLSNLVGNAVKFTERGYVAVTLDCLERGDRVELVLAVRDTGIGIPEGRRERIFEPFCQAEASTARHFGGTGLGLSICKHFVERMGGRLRVESAPGQGSTFSFSLELEQAAEDRSTPAAGLEGHDALLWTREGVADTLGVLDKLVASGANVRLAESFDQACDALRAPGLEFVVLEAVVLGELDDAEHELVHELLDGAKVFVLVPRGTPAPVCSRAAHYSVLELPLRRQRLLDRLRAAPAPAPAPADEAPAPYLADPAAELPRVLLAEDNEINCIVAVRTITKLGFAVDVAANGREAVEAVERDDYEIVLMDCQMPEMDGYEATERIRSLPGAKARTPILALTANVQESDRQRCFAAGMDGYLSKPFDLKSLGDAIRELLAKCERT